MIAKKHPKHTHTHTHTQTHTHTRAHMHASTFAYTHIYFVTIVKNPGSKMPNKARALCIP